MKNNVPDISIIILNYNTCSLTKKCLEQIYSSQLKNYSIEVIPKNTLKTNEKVLKINTSIRSFKHQVFTYQCVKVCLSSFDDKVYRESFNVGYP